MVRDFKYIIKRIIIGVGIALALMLIKGNLIATVQAKTIESYNWGYTSDSVVYSTNTYDKAVNPHPFIDYGTGYLYFTFDIIGNTMQPAMNIRSVIVSTAVNDYVCHVGSTTNTSGYQSGGTGTSSNQTTTYSAFCPVNMDSTGLHWVHVNFNGVSNPSATFTIAFSSQVTFESADDVTLNTTDTTNAINNQITNDNTNTNNIINNQNDNTQQQIESQRVCKDKWYRYSDLPSSNVGFLTDFDSVYSSNSWRYSDYIPVSAGEIIVNSDTSVSSAKNCFYDKNYTGVSCYLSNTSITTVPNGVSYVRFNIHALSNDSNYTIVRSCKNGNQAIADGQQDINDTLNNDDVTGATGTAESFFDDFQSDSHGLSGIITAPLRLIQSLSTSTCSSLTIPLPFVDTNATLPCMSTIYSTYFPTFLSLYQLITTGLIGYWVLIKIFGHVKGMQDPKDDRIEVLDL